MYSSIETPVIIYCANIMHKKRIVLLCTEPSSSGKADEALPVQRETYRTERGDEFPQSDVSRQSDYRP